MSHKHDEQSEAEDFSPSQGLPDLAAVLEFLSQFKGAQQHLMQAGVELVSAAAAALESVLRSLEEDYPNLRQKWEFLYGLQYGLGFVANYLNKNSNKPSSEYKRNVHKLAALESIIEVLEKEMEKLSDVINQTGKVSEKNGGAAASDLNEKRVQLGAMLAIKNVLEREMQNAGKAPGKKSASAHARDTSSTAEHKPRSHRAKGRGKKAARKSDD